MKKGAIIICAIVVVLLAYAATLQHGAAKSKSVTTGKEKTAVSAAAKPTTVYPDEVGGAIATPHFASQILPQYGASRMQPNHGRIPPDHRQTVLKLAIVNTKLWTHFPLSQKKH